jgi:putative copper export protein
MPTPQTYANHRQFVPAFHFGLLVVLVLTLIGSCVNLYQSWGDHHRLYSAALLVVLTLSVIMVGLFARMFALKAQDRAIRAEEQLRHYVLAGRLLDPRLTIRQIIGLRFAGDAEFLVLADRAAREGLSEDDIKRAVRHWRVDTYRV